MTSSRCSACSASSRRSPSSSWSSSAASGFRFSRVKQRYVRSFAAFWWDFIVGDDWRVAAGVVIALGLTAMLTDYGWSAWWLLPLAVAVLLGRSLQRATRSG